MPPQPHPASTIQSNTGQRAELARAQSHDSEPRRLILGIGCAIALSIPLWVGLAALFQLF
jgi:hypothetical protein